MCVDYYAPPVDRRVTADPVDRETMHQLLMDLDDVAALMREHPSTVAGRARRGQVPGVKIGSQWRFWRPSVMAAVVGDVAARTAPMPEVDPDPEVVGPAELGELLGISLTTTMALLRAGQIPSGRTGSRWHIYWPAVRDAIAAGTPLDEGPPDG